MQNLLIRECQFSEEQKLAIASATNFFNFSGDQSLESARELQLFQPVLVIWQGKKQLSIDQVTYVIQKT
jgi:hypothetical protein